MRKFIPVIVLILLVVAIELGSTYYVGTLAEERFRHTISLMNEMPGTKAEVVSYQRGFFNSQAKIVIAIFNQPFVILSTVYHGPIIFKKSEKFPLQFHLAYVSNELETPQVKVPINWAMVFPFMGGAEMRSTSPQYVSEQNNLIIKSTGWNAVGKISKDWDDYTLDAKSPDFSMAYKGDMEGPFLNVQGIQVHSDYKKSENSKTTQFNYVFDKIILSKQDVEINKLELQNEFVTNTDTINSLLKISLEGLILSKNQTLGTQKIEVKIDNIDLNAMTTLLKTTQKRLTNEELRAVFNLLLQKRSKFSIVNSHVHLPNGSIILDAQMEVGGQTLPDPMNIDEVIKTIDGKLFARITKTLFQDLIAQMAAQELMKDPQFVALSNEEKQAKLQQEIDRFISVLAESQLLKDLGQEYEITATFAKGQWLMNGKPKESTQEGSESRS